MIDNYTFFYTSARFSCNTRQKVKLRLIVILPSAEVTTHSLVMPKTCFHSRTCNDTDKYTTEAHVMPKSQSEFFLDHFTLRTTHSFMHLKTKCSEACYKYIKVNISLLAILSAVRKGTGLSLACIGRCSKHWCGNHALSNLQTSKA